MCRDMSPLPRVMGGGLRALSIEATGRAGTPALLGVDDWLDGAWGPLHPQQTWESVPCFRQS